MTLAVTTRPVLSARARSNAAHRNAEVLGVTIGDDGSVKFGCNHCGWTGPEKGKGNGAGGPPLMAYVYRDRDGGIQFRKVRNLPGLEPRFFFQHPDGDRWLKGAGGADTGILYRLDEVAKAIADGHEIACVEGEKDADRLCSLGIPATCNAHGASEPDKKAKWTKEHSAQLKGADVIVLNDNDPPGYAHAETTCKLSLRVAKRVRRLDLKRHWPEMPQGGDVSDWLDQGHTREELEALIAAAPDYAPEHRPNGNGTVSEAADPVDDDAELVRLAKLPLVEYERARKAAAEALGVRASMLDRLIAMKRTELGLDHDDGKQGRPIEFLTPEPWPGPVDGAALLDDVAAVLSRYVIMGEYERVAVALWSVHAYLLDRLMISPRLAIRSAVKGSGKTTCLDVLARLVPRPLLAASVTPSAIFRVIAAHAPTLLVDEADTLFGNGDETLRGVLNAGHRKGGAVLRVVGDDLEPRAFPCFAATAIALIGQLPGTLADRSVDIVLARRLPSEAITPFRLDQTERLDELARRMTRWAKDNGERVGHDPDIPPGIHNRAADNWRPLLAIAEAAGGTWPNKARKAAMTLAGGDVDEASRTELLLSDICDIFAGSNDGETPLDEITSAALIERLIAIVPRPWAECGKGGKPITQNKLARFLKPLGIGPKLLGDFRLHGYRRAQFDDAFERYLSPQPPVSNRSPAHNPAKPGESDPIQTAHLESGRAVSNSAEAKQTQGYERMSGLEGGSSGLCALCGSPGGEFCAWGDRTVWLHPECQRAYASGDARPA